MTGKVPADWQMLGICDYEQLSHYEQLVLTGQVSHDLWRPWRPNSFLRVKQDPPVRVKAAEFLEHAALYYISFNVTPKTCPESESK